MSALHFNFVHGHAGKSRSKEYRAWKHAKGRCYCATDASYPLYGARGITMCDRWRNDFVTFLFDIGHAPSPIHSLDRIDPDGNYEPKNCRWALPTEQANNRRTSRLISFRGQTLTVTQWAEHLHLPVNSISARLSAGWSIERSLTEPINLLKGRRKPGRQVSAAYLPCSR